MNKLQDIKITGKKKVDRGNDSEEKIMGSQGKENVLFALT
jgi:hypothetical protein